MGAWRMDGGLLRAMALAFGLAGLLMACDDDCPEGSSPHGDCVGATHYTKGEVSASIGAEVAFDSVQVTLFRGTVESGSRVESATYRNGSRHLHWSVDDFGDYSVQAIYWRGNVSVEAVDGGSTRVDQNTEC
ncbi:MAG: hypothetical protein RL318_834, partial [Fibrobacterota bacterium]